MRVWRNDRRGRAAIWLLLAAALFLRAAVPQGTMPDAGGGRFVAVPMCNSAALWHIPLGQTGEDSGEEPDEDSGGDQPAAPCAFAGLGSPAAPPPVLPDLLPPAIADHAFARVAVPAAPPALPAPRPPARGPPLPA